jgi:hypothetical protein
VKAEKILGETKDKSGVEPKRTPGSISLNSLDMLKLDSSLTAIALFASAALVNAEQGGNILSKSYFTLALRQT